MDARCSLSYRSCTSFPSTSTVNSGLVLCESATSSEYSSLHPYGATCSLAANTSLNNMIVSVSNRSVARPRLPIDGVTEGERPLSVKEIRTAEIYDIKEGGVTVVGVKILLDEQRYGEGGERGD